MKKPVPSSRKTTTRTPKQTKSSMNFAASAPSAHLRLGIGVDHSDPSQLTDDEDEEDDENVIYHDGTLEVGGEDTDDDMDDDEEEEDDDHDEEDGNMEEEISTTSVESSADSVTQGTISAQHTSQDIVQQQQQAQQMQGSPSAAGAGGNKFQQQSAGGVDPQAPGGVVVSRLKKSDITQIRSIKVPAPTQAGLVLNSQTQELEAARITNDPSKTAVTLGVAITQDEAADQQFSTNNNVNTNINVNSRTPNHDGALPDHHNLTNILQQQQQQQRRQQQKQQQMGTPSSPPSKPQGLQPNSSPTTITIKSSHPSSARTPLKPRIHGSSPLSNGAIHRQEDKPLAENPTSSSHNTIQSAPPFVADIRRFDAKQGFITIHGLKVHYKVCYPTFDPQRPIFGNRRNIVLFHGALSNLATWQCVQQALADSTGCRVLSYDRIGHGLSDKPTKWSSKQQPNPYLNAGQLALCQDLLRALGMHEHLVLIGNGTGGTLAAALALSIPQSIRGLILIAPAIFDESPPLYLRACVSFPPPLSWLYRSLYGNHAPLRQMYYKPDRIFAQPKFRAMYSQPAKSPQFWSGLAKACKYRSNFNIRSHLASLTAVATLVVTGDVDEVVPTIETLRLFQSLQQVRKPLVPQVLKIIRKAGHLPQEECPDEFARVAGFFIRKVCLTGGGPGGGAPTSPLSRHRSGKSTKSGKSAKSGMASPSAEGVGGRRGSKATNKRSSQPPKPRS